MFAAIESQEVFVQELHEIVETYFEEELVIEGEFVTEQTMLGWGYSECLGLLLIPFRGSQCDHARMFRIIRGILVSGSGWMPSRSIAARTLQSS